jgi:hypothetical protein
MESPQAILIEEDSGSGASDTVLRGNLLAATYICHGTFEVYLRALLNDVLIIDAAFFE